MKFSSVSIALLLTSGLGLRAQTPAPSASADADWVLVEKSFPGDGQRPTTGGNPAVFAWGIRYVAHLLDTGAEFFEKHPDDPRRWTALEQMENKFTSWTAAAHVNGQDGVVDGVMPAAMRAEWRRRLDRWIADALVARDIPADQRLRFDALSLTRARSVVYHAIAAKTPPDLAPVRAELERLAAKYPEQDTIGTFAVHYLELAASAGIPAEKLQAERGALVEHSHPAIRAHVAAKLAHDDEMSKPLEIAFTAADGRAVDLAKLRGKVVLVDFWATWCGPCKAELPNVVANYKKYHQDGFEIVGISLENAKLTPGDTPEQQAAKLAGAKKTLADFTAGHDMPWPQYFDGKFWKNDLVTRFAITGIPAMFLLDQNGKIVSTNARGEKLESEVKRLLKL